MHIEKEEEEECETNQATIGMQHLLRGHAIKAWTGVNFNQTKHHSLNKILIKHCVLHYTKCWKHRNEIYHDEEKQRERALKWKEELEKHVEANEPMKVKLFVRNSMVNVNACETESIFRWIKSVRKLIKEVKEVPSNDIRRYFACK